MSVLLYNPGTKQFAQSDPGRVSENVLLLNILIELRVHSVYLASMSSGIVIDDLSTLRVDQVNDPDSLTTNTSSLKV